MWQKFTERARKAVFHAQEEAGKYGENFVATEHLLLGILHEENNTACEILNKMGVTPNMVREELKKDMTQGRNAPVSGEMQLTPRAKIVIDNAYDEANSFEHDFIGSEHLLLGLIRESECIAGKTLSKFGVDLQTVREAVLNIKPRGFMKSSVITGEQIAQEIISKANMQGKDLPGISSLTINEIECIFEITRKMKEGAISPEKQRQLLHGKTLAMIFEKPSLRTRVSFETGIFQLGGHGIYLAPSDISLGKRESVADVARTLDRMCDIIMARVFEHDKILQLAEAASVPVINGLSDLEHPCQALADFYTIIEKKGELKGLKLAFVGDGNNVAHSLMLLAAKVGTHFTIGCPEGYEPNSQILREARESAKESGAQIEVIHDAAKAVDGADVVYTDVWASMGQEAEAEERAKIFAPFQVNAELMKHAKDDAIFEHCLPAHRGSEVTDEVIDGKWSVVFDEAENRMHVQKGIMVLLGGYNG